MARRASGREIMTSERKSEAKAKRRSNTVHGAAYSVQKHSVRKGVGEARRRQRLSPKRGRFSVP